jgi:hypothetical protein
VLPIRITYTTYKITKYHEPEYHNIKIHGRENTRHFLTSKYLKKKITIETFWPGEQTAKASGTNETSRNCIEKAPRTPQDSGCGSPGLLN